MPKEKEPIIIYQAENGALQISVDSENQTVWLTQIQISKLFDVDRSVITKHIQNVYLEKELEEDSTSAIFAQVRKEGGREVNRKVRLYSLDLILSVGYRVNSKKATKFRQWANQILKDYLIKGYSINQKLLETKHQQIDEIRKTLDFLVKSGKVLLASDQFLELLNKYSSSLITLNQYDENRLKVNQGAKSVQIEIEELRNLIGKTKSKLMAENEATELFGLEQGGKFESTIGAVYQTFGGQDLYNNLEEKAANLLYLIVKNHSFADGNKRIGSILFIYFLAKNNFLYRENGEAKINDNALVALALLVAQSNPNDKEILVKLIINLIQK